MDPKVLAEAADIKSYTVYINAILTSNKGTPDWKTVTADAQDPHSLGGQLVELARIKEVAFDDSRQGKEAKFLAGQVHQVSS